jgi:hypothetical protein
MQQIVSGHSQSSQSELIANLGGLHFPGPRGSILGRDDHHCLGNIVKSACIDSLYVLMMMMLWGNMQVSFRRIRFVRAGLTVLILITLIS